MPSWPSSCSLANGGSLDNIQPGIDFFARLKREEILHRALKRCEYCKGRSCHCNHVGHPWPGLPRFVQGQTQSFGSYTIRRFDCWSLRLNCEQDCSKPLRSTPRDLGYIFSDEGQLFYLKGYAHPARYQALVAANKIPADLAAKLPPATEYTNVKFPSLAQLTAASTVVAQNWGSQVLGS